MQESNTQEKNAQTMAVVPKENTAMSVESAGPTAVSSSENILRRHIKEDPRKKLLAKHRLWMDNLLNPEDRPECFIEAA